MLQNSDWVLSEHRDKYVLTKTAIKENNIDSLKSTPIESQNIKTISNTVINKAVDSDTSPGSKYLQDIDMRVSYSKIGYENEE